MGAASPVATSVFTTGDDITLLLYFVLPVWLLGTLVGLLVRCIGRSWCLWLGGTTVSSIPFILALHPQLPRPKWLETWTRTSTLLLPTPMGVFFRRTALLCHAGLIVRCVMELPPASLIVCLLCADAVSVRVCPMYRDVWRNFTAPGTFRKLLRDAWQWLVQGKVGGDVQGMHKGAQRDVVSRPIHDDHDWYVGGGLLGGWRVVRWVACMCATVPHHTQVHYGNGFAIFPASCRG